MKKIKELKEIKFIVSLLRNKSKGKKKLLYLS